MITRCIKSNARDYDIQLRQGRSGKDSLTGLLQARSSVGWLPVSFQSPAYRELHICRVRSLSEKPEHQQLYHAARHCNFAALFSYGISKTAVKFNSSFYNIRILWNGYAIVIISATGMMKIGRSVGFATRNAKYLDVLGSI